MNFKLLGEGMMGENHATGNHSSILASLKMTQLEIMCLPM